MKQILSDHSNSGFPKWSNNLKNSHIPVGSSFEIPRNSVFKHATFALVLLFLVLGFPTESYTQKHKVENVSFTVLPENIVVVSYDLTGKDKRYLVDLNLRKKTIPQFKFEPEATFGKVGKGKFAGSNNKIIWSLDNEEKEFFIDPFQDDFYIEVSARRKRRTGWFWATTLVGAAVFVVTQTVDM